MEWRGWGKVFQLQTCEWYQQPHLRIEKKKKKKHQWNYFDVARGQISVIYDIMKSKWKTFHHLYVRRSFTLL